MPLPGAFAEPRLFRHILELAVAQVVIQPVRNARVAARIAIVLLAAHGATEVEFAESRYV